MFSRLLGSESGMGTELFPDYDDTFMMILKKGRLAKKLRNN